MTGVFEQLLIDLEVDEVTLYCIFNDEVIRP